MFLKLHLQLILMINDAHGKKINPLNEKKIVNTSLSGCWCVEMLNR